MKIYTKTGDTGETGLFGGPRVAKDHPRIEAYGSVDELNAVLGWARTESLPADIDAVIALIQHQLFALGAELASPDPATRGTDWIGDAEVEALERAIDDTEAKLPALKEFVLPGGSRAAGALHVARTVCRRAERCLVSLRASSGDSVRATTVVYLNRLSDLLFVLARAANQQAGRPDVIWVKPTRNGGEQRAEGGEPEGCRAGGELGS